MNKRELNPITLVAYEDEYGNVVKPLNALIKSAYEHDALGMIHATSELCSTEFYKKQRPDFFIRLDDAVKAALAGNAKELDKAVEAILSYSSHLAVYATEYELAKNDYTGYEWRDACWEENTIYNGTVVFYNGSDILQENFPVSTDFIRCSPDEVLPF